MAYSRKQKKDYGIRFGQPAVRSGYIKPSWDPMPPYRLPSTPETEYSRKVKNAALRSEVTGPSPISSSNYAAYRNNLRFQKYQGRLSQSEVEKIVRDSLADAIEEVKTKTGQAELPQQDYERMLETASKLGKRQSEIHANPDDKTTVVDFVNEFLQGKPRRITTEELSDLNDVRQELVRRMWKEAEKATTLDELDAISADIDKINSNFFRIMDESESKKEIPAENILSLWDQVEQKFGGIKMGIDMLKEQHRNLSSEIESGISELDKTGERLANLEVEIERVQDVNPLLESSGLKRSEVNESHEPLSQAELTSYSEQLQPDINYQKRKYLDYDSEIGY